LNNYLIIVCGPTASGKSELAIELAQFYKTEIISADSRQFVKELSIGTAKPNKEQLQCVPHHFIDSHSIHDQYSAGQFGIDARLVLKELFKKHKAVIICGGSGLYIDAIVKSFDSLAPNNLLLREQLNEEFANEGISILQEKAKAIDPNVEKLIDIHNSRRLIRFIEKNSQPIAGIDQSLANIEFKAHWIGIKFERSVLYERINRRVDQMIKEGLVEEAKSFYHFKNNHFLKTVGYMELFEYFDGITTLDQAVEKIKQHTRNFAKRQMTWFRKNEDIIWLENHSLKAVEDILENKL